MRIIDCSSDVCSSDLSGQGYGVRCLALVIRLRSRGAELIKYFVLALAAAATGCASKPPTMYYWGNYQAQTYAYLKGDTRSPDGGASILEADIEKARAVRKRVG